MRILNRFLTIIICSLTYAQNLSQFTQKNLLLPPPPNVTAEAYIVMDAITGSVLAEKNANQQLAPASLTKLMTSYIVFHALSQGHLRLDDQIHISTNAWKTEGSRLFLNENSYAPLQTLLKGLIITSGNDATVAISEHFAGSEENFASIMNRYAEKLNMNNTHYVTTTGLEHPEHFSSAQDIATLSSHVINEFPEYFHWFHEKSITYNGITQNNRNKLLKTHPEIDGLKTGHTSAAGYCLATTAQKNNTRLIVITLKSPSTKQRDQDTLALLNYGFRFYETTLLYPKNTIISNTPVYTGIISNINVETHDPFWATIPKGAKENMKIDIQVNEPIQTPLSKSDVVGTISAYLDDVEISSAPLYPSDDVQASSGFRYTLGSIQLMFQKWFL